MFLDDFFKGSCCWRRLFLLVVINATGDKLPTGNVDNATKLFIAVFDAGRVSLETSFDWQQQKLELIGTIQNKTFVSVVSLIYQNREFRCFD
jgi:hypothetical protein